MSLLTVDHAHVLLDAIHQLQCDEHMRSLLARDYDAGQHDDPKTTPEGIHRLLGEAREFLERAVERDLNLTTTYAGTTETKEV